MTYIPPYSRLGLSTALIESDGPMAVNPGDNTKFDIPRGIYRFIDHSEDVVLPEPIILELGPFTGVDLPLLPTEPATTVLIQVDGTGPTSHDHVVRVSFNLDPAPLRTQVYLGAIAHTQNAQIEFINPVVLNGSSNDYGMAIVDMGLALEPVSIGNRIVPAGVDLSIKKEAGEFFNPGVNFFNDPFFPNYLAVPELDPATFLYTWRDGLGGHSVSVGNTQLDPDSYDDGTGGTTEPNGVVTVPKWSVQKVFVSQNSVFIQFGTEVYNTLNVARTLFRSEDFDLFPQLAGSPFAGWIFLRGGSTNASLIGDAYFLPASKFSEPTG